MKLLSLEYSLVFTPSWFKSNSWANAKLWRTSTWAKIWSEATEPVTVAFEACSTSNYRYQQAIKAGHDARLISAKLIRADRHNQKTDKNDALAIAQTLFLAEVSFINGKSVEQQQLQSIQRLREIKI